jgi:hypothetical protein
MSDYNWCHGPECHKRSTTTRVRGVKGSKVLRTMKVKYRTPPDREARSYRWFRHWDNYFCDQTCLHDFVEKNIQALIALAPRTEALETPIDVKVETRTDYFGKPYKQKVLQAIDNA